MNKENITSSYFVIKSVIDEGVMNENYIKLNYEKDIYLYDKKTLLIQIGNDIIKRPWLYINYLSPSNYEGILRINDYERYESCPEKLLNGIEYTKYNKNENYISLTKVLIIKLYDEKKYNTLFTYILYTISSDYKEYSEDDGINIFITDDLNKIIEYIFANDYYYKRIKDTIKWGIKYFEYENIEKINEKKIIQNIFNEKELRRSPLINEYYDKFQSILLLKLYKFVNILDLLNKSYCHILSSRSTWNFFDSVVILPEENNFEICNYIINLIKFSNNMLLNNNDVQNIIFRIKRILSSNLLLSLPTFSSNDLLNRAFETHVDGDSSAEISIKEITYKRTIDIDLFD